MVGCGLSPVERVEHIIVLVARVVRRSTLLVIIHHHLVDNLRLVLALTEGGSTHVVLLVDCARFLLAHAEVGTILRRVMWTVTTTP